MIPVSSVFGSENAESVRQIVAPKAQLEESANERRSRRCSLKSQLRVGSDKNHDFLDYPMEIVVCTRPISEQNTIKKVSDVVQNDTEALCDLWFAFPGGIFIINVQKIVQLKDRYPYLFIR